MCGLYFSIGFPPAPERLDLVAHRGPDGRDWRELTSPAGQVCLGHRRLAIIDLDARANQPMQSGDGRLLLLFNGEIYNYRELRAELETQRVTFRTQSDAEVLLEGYARWGEDVLPKLRGMFAFLIWDQQDHVLFAARDPFGIKPLYVVNARQGVAFGSEIKQLLDLPGAERRLNRGRIWDFLVSQATDHTEETLFEGVRQLRGGHGVRLDLARWRPGDPLPMRRWFELPSVRGVGMSEVEAADTFRTLFEDAIKLHLRADVEVGSCLSGGLDSSSVVGVASRQLRGVRVLNTFSARFPNTEVDESRYMDAVARFSGANPHAVHPDPEALFAQAEKITYHQDEPFGSTSIFAQWSMFDAIRRAGVKVVLDGQGADELLAGYHGVFDFHFASLARQGRYIDLSRALVEHKLWHGAAIARLAQRFAGRVLKRAAAPSAGAPWIGPALTALRPPEGDTMAAALARDGLPRLDSIAQLCLAQTQVGLPALLHWEDRNSMAHSVEARLPFLDPPLAGFALALGDRHKIVGADTKRVLRRALAADLPPEVAHRRDKFGFATPEQTWFTGRLRPLVETGIAEAISWFPDLFDNVAVKRYAYEVLDASRPFDTVLWRIVNLGQWARVFRVSA